MDCLSFFMPRREASHGPGRKGPRRQPLGAETGETGACLPLPTKRLSFQPPTGAVRARFIRFRTGFARPVRVDQGSAPGFCGMAFETQSVGFLSLTEYAMQLSSA